MTDRHRDRAVTGGNACVRVHRKGIRRRSNGVQVIANHEKILAVQCDYGVVDGPGDRAQRGGIVKRAVSVEFAEACRPESQ